MLITISSSQTSLVASLRTQGISPSKTKLVESELAFSIATVSPMGIKADAVAVRTALNQRMSADVASGKLTQKDADAVNKTLDDLAKTDNTASGATVSADGQTATGAASGEAATKGAGGGGGGSATKTEQSRVVVVSGALETITITYTDGTTETETKVSDGDASTKSTATSNASQKAASYADGDKLPSGSLVDQTA